MNIYCNFYYLIGKVHFSEQGTLNSPKEQATFMEFIDLYSINLRVSGGINHLYELGNYFS